MKYAGMPLGMWALFAGSFRQRLTAVPGYDTETAKTITKANRTSKNGQASRRDACPPFYLYYTSGMAW